MIFGPSCEYSLASVARQIKFYRVPLLTAGGLALDFEIRNKTKFEDEFYLLTNTGYNFMSVARAVYKFMEEVGWRKILLVYR